MRRLTIRLSAEKHERLRELAEWRKISMSKLIDELSALAPTSERDLTDERRHP